MARLSNVNRHENTLAQGIDLNAYFHTQIQDTRHYISYNLLEERKMEAVTQIFK
jgi:hypothetical protein